MVKNGGLSEATTGGQLTFLTLPERMQRVQTCKRTWEPLSLTALMDCKFGLDIFFDLLLAWLTLFPLSLPFPQISHLPATVKSSVEHKVKKHA